MMNAWRKPQLIVLGSLPPCDPDMMLTRHLWGLYGSIVGIFFAALMGSSGSSY
jgi:hypothetical protein